MTFASAQPRHSILDETSSIVNSPPGLQLDLFRHQKAMLCKSLQIEKTIKNSQIPYAFMCDKAGSGKTAVIISLIMYDKILHGKTLNLIVVPQNIHSQWISEIERFAGDSLAVKSYINYSDISGAER